MKLRPFLHALEKITCSVTGNVSGEILHITMDSREVKPRSLFCAIRGSNTDGHKYLDIAVQKGAVCCVISGDSSWQAPDPDFPVVRVSDSYFAWGILCETFLGKPADSLQLFAVTGTNGKTTVTWLLRSILRNAFPDRKCGLITTVEYNTGGDTLPEESSRTTPESMDLQKLFARMKEEKCTYAVMEQSSHGLHQFRAGTTLYAGAVFTNLTGDHLDYHGDMEHYFQAKKLLFTRMLRRDAPAVILIDNPWGKRLFEELKKENRNVCGVTLCAQESADAVVDGIRTTLEGSDFTIHFEGKSIPFHIPLCGKYNICNAAEALLLAWKKGIPIAILQKAAAGFQAPPGRLEKFFLPRKGAYAFVDYAHTDDALCQVLQTLSGLGGKRIITVFGCGGDRDRTKRPRMAQAASGYSHEVILTHDNPRNEDPARILNDIIQGFPAGYRFRIVEDRKEAIETALNAAGEADMVLIAGKGHENYQLVRGVKNHFDDREAVLQYIEKNI